MTQKHDYELIIFGGGSAGIVSGVVAGALGLRVLLIEKGTLGGECLNTGCVPSKALLHAAQVAQTLRTADKAGFKPVQVRPEDSAGALRFVRETIAAVGSADASEALLEGKGVTVRRGDAHFVDPHTVEMQGERLSAANFILATGSHPRTPEIEGLADAGFLTNQTVFDLQAVPERLCVIGGGPNGVEMAQAFGRLGSKVTLVQNRERLLPRDDIEAVSALAGFLREEGIDIRFSATVCAVRVEDEQKIAVVQQGDGRTEIACDEILVTTGRRPNTEGLNLEAAGVEYDDARVKTDESLRTTAPHIYACGDLLGHDQFSHMAEQEARQVVMSIVFPGSFKPDFSLQPWATFTDPELAHLGLTEEDAQAQGVRYEVYRQPFAQDDRALTEGTTQGFVKVLASGLTGKIVGVHILGPRAGELMAEWILAMKHGHSIRDIADLVHIYPTLTLASQHAAQRWYERWEQQPVAQGALRLYVQALRPHGAAIAAGLAGAALAAIGFRLVQGRKTTD